MIAELEKPFLVPTPPRVGDSQRPQEEEEVCGGARAGGAGGHGVKRNPSQGQWLGPGTEPSRSPGQGATRWWHRCHPAPQAWTGTRPQSHPPCGATSSSQAGCVLAEAGRTPHARDAASLV